MGFKIGGGDHLQYYDESNGQYSDEWKAGAAEKDKENLVLFYYFGLDYPELIFHFPKYGFHDDEYCEIFVLYARSRIRGLTCDPRKGKYLLTYTKSKDKSAFFNSIGYSYDDATRLVADIVEGTDVKTLKFSKLSNYGPMTLAKTMLNGEIVTSVWELQHNFDLKLVTIIPGGDKKWLSK